MKKIKSLCSKIRSSLKKGEGINSTFNQMFDLLEMIVGHLSQQSDSAKDSKKMIIGALKDELKGLRSKGISVRGMVKPQQYRIGNYFRIDGHLHCVEKIEATKINGIDIDRIAPVIVNHAILEDLGFEAKSMDRYELISGEKGIFYHSIEEDINIMYGARGFTYCELYQNTKHVHQLQNIHFDLFKKELRFS